MKDYYKKTDIAKVYLVASVLDPRIKLRYFEINWQPAWLVGARDKLDQYLEEFTIAMKINMDKQEALDGEMFDSQTSDESFGSWRQADCDAAGIGGEWVRYLNTARVKDYNGFSIRNWWIAHQDEFPILSQVALETLAISAMSVEVERVFSGYHQEFFYALIIGSNTHLPLFGASCCQKLLRQMKCASRCTRVSCSWSDLMFWKEESIWV